MEAAIEERFSRYDGDSLYHLGISVEGYVLAQCRAFRSWRRRNRR